jgi:hypothetical protein
MEVAPILNVSDLNASFAWFAALGWVEPPEDRPWGVREMHVRHPDGHVIRFSAASPHEHPHG